MNPWPYIENIAILCCACGLAYAWDTPWPLLLLVFANQISSIQRGEKK